LFLQTTGVYIPVSPLLLEMLQWSELKRTPTGGAAAAPDMLLLLRLSKTQLKMASLQEEVVNQVSMWHTLTVPHCSCG
jgi:nucleolar complex protein 2